MTLMVKSKLRGHDIEYLNDEWIYSDTKKPTNKTWSDRPCGHCDKMPTPEGHDPCLGTLPGVMNACCGHGTANGAYIQYLDGSDIRGQEAIQEINRLIGND